jgi:hypothetical protein
MAFPGCGSIGRALLGAALCLAALTTPCAAMTQGHADLSAQDPEATGDAGSKKFNCQDGGAINYRFATERGKLVAIVDAFDGYGPHTLAARPYAGPPVELVWSDGHRTLTWSPGVQIMWMDEGAHRMCGGGMHHH